MRDNIFIIDQRDDERQGIASALTGVAAEFRAFSCADHFLQQVEPDAEGCIIAPSDLDGIGTRALIESVRARGLALQIIVLGRNADFAKAIELVRAGAFEFLEPPVSDRRLRSIVRRAMQPSPRRL